MCDHRRCALITGASSGIGHAIATRLTAQDWRVIGLGRDFERRSPPPEGFTAMALDLADLASLPDKFESIAEHHPDIDTVIFNAGYGRFGGLEEFSPSQIHRLIDVNLTSHILLARTFVPRLRKNGRGDLLFIGSESALAGGRWGAVYSATKFALRGLAQSLRLECAGSGVRVSIINPGMVKSEFFDRLHFAPGEDEANYVLPGDVADAASMVLSARPGTVFDEINLSPMKRVVRSRPGKSG